MFWKKHPVSDTVPTQSNSNTVPCALCEHEVRVEGAVIVKVWYQPERKEAYPKPPVTREWAANLVTFAVPCFEEYFGHPEFSFNTVVLDDHWQKGAKYYWRDTEPPLGTQYTEYLAGATKESA